jgi:energy-coupling factor transporter transmembrane protein EcfT
MKKKTLKVVLCVCTLLVLLLAIIFPKATWAYLVELVLALAVMGILAFNTKEKHNATRVILIVFIGLMLLSWIIPAAYFSGDYVDQGRAQMGLLICLIIH